MNKYKNRNRISIAVCTYNGERFLDDQIASLLKQTRQPDEVVVCDDGSTDSTLEILDRFSKQTQFPVYIHRNIKHLGPAKNFEQAITLCKGEFIALCDQDDVWLPSKLEVSMDRLLDKTGLEAVFSDGIVVDASLNPLGYSLWNRVRFNYNELLEMNNGRGLEVLLKHFKVTGAALMINRQILERALPIPNGWMHDAWLALMAATADSLRPIPTTLLLYRQHGGNTIGAARPKLINRWQEVLSTDRSSYYNIEIERYNAAYDRLQAFPQKARPDALALLKAKLRHLQSRADLPTSRLFRIAPILSELAKHGYHHYSASWQVAVKDFLL